MGTKRKLKLGFTIAGIGAGLALIGELANLGGNIHWLSVGLIIAGIIVIYFPNN